MVNGHSMPKTSNDRHTPRVSLVRPADRARRDGRVLRKLDPRIQVRNPVMFVVFVGSIFTTVIGVGAASAHSTKDAGFILAVAAWLWLTVLFANFAEAMAEGRGKAQAATLCDRCAGDVQRQEAARTAGDALAEPSRPARCARRHCARRSGDIIPADGESSKASHRSTKAPSPAKSAPVFARAAATRSA